MNALIINAEDMRSSQRVNELLDDYHFITAQALTNLQKIYPDLYAVRSFTPIELEGFYRIGGPGLL